jgi:hypothetical protein
MRGTAIAFTGVHRIEVVDISIPELRPDEVLVQTELTAVSQGTDRAMVAGTYRGVEDRYPFIYGYSRVGRVVEVGGAAVIIAPRFPRLKEWAYAGAFFQWSGAVATHLLRGDYTPVSVWLTPLMFAMFAIASWALRPADRRLPNSGLPPETRPFAWAVPIGILLFLYAVSFLTLRPVEAALHARAVELGWVAH